MAMTNAERLLRSVLMTHVNNQRNPYLMHETNLIRVLSHISHLAHIPWSVVVNTIKHGTCKLDPDLHDQILYVWETFRKRQATVDEAHCVERLLARDYACNNIVCGTYLPEDLFLSVALWVSNEFYVKSHKIIKSQEFEERYRNDVCLLQERLQQIEFENERMKAENEKIKTENQRIQLEKDRCRHENQKIQLEKERYRHVVETYRLFKEDITFKTADAGKLHIFAVIRKNDPASFALCVVRSQRIKYGANVKELIKKYPDMEIVFELRYNPNSVNLFNRIKERVERIECRYNDVRLLDGYTENEFIRDIRRVAESDVDPVNCKI